MAFDHNKSSNPFRARSGYEEPSEAWLISYADMVTLLLSFFVVFVSTSEPQENKLAAATRGMQSRFGSVDLSTPFAGAYRTLVGIIEENAAFEDMSVEKTGRSLTIELDANRFFIPGTDEFNINQIGILTEMASGLKSDSYKQYHFAIESHSSDVEPISHRFKTNWDITAARAVKMIKFFKEQGHDITMMRAEAYAHTKPKLPNADRTGEPIPENQKRNERLVIRMMREL